MPKTTKPIGSTISANQLQAQPPDDDRDTIWQTVRVEQRHERTAGLLSLRTASLIRNVLVQTGWPNARRSDRCRVAWYCCAFSTVPAEQRPHLRLGQILRLLEDQGHRVVIDGEAFVCLAEINDQAISLFALRAKAAGELRVDQVLFLMVTPARFG